MAHRIRKHSKYIATLIKPKPKEILYSKKGNIFLNNAQSDRVSFSVLRNKENNLRKIENISYEININDQWEWVVRYDDHDGSSFLHRHIRISLKDSKSIESSAGIKKYRNKDYELTWVINEIKRNYKLFRTKFMKNSGLDLY